MNKKYNFDLSKRKFLKESAGIGFLTIAPGIFCKTLQMLGIQTYC